MRARCCWMAALPPPPPGLPGGKASACQCRRHQRRGFDPRVRKIPWKREWQPTPVSLPGKPPWAEEPGRPQSMGHRKLDMTGHTHPCGTTRPLDIDPRTITAITGERMIVHHDDKSDRKPKTRQRFRFSPLRLTKFQNDTFCCKTLGKEYSHGWLL